MKTKKSKKSEKKSNNRKDLTKNPKRVNSGVIAKTRISFQKELRPELLIYNAEYEGNPILPALQKLYDSGRLKLDTDERRYLADLLAEEISNQAELSGLGAPIIRQIINWVKGRRRADVIR